MSEGVDTGFAMSPRDAPASSANIAVPEPRAGHKRHGRTRIVVVGEFNSGKTTLVNALVGAPVLTPSAISSTVYPTVVAFAARPSVSGETADRRRTPVGGDGLDHAVTDDIRRLHVGAPLERLRRLTVIDTPGLGQADCENDRCSLDACRNADTVIWCTPAMQAWKASEQQAWLMLPPRSRARGLLAVTFADVVPCKADLDRLLERLHAEAGPYFRHVALAHDCAALALAAARPGARHRQPRLRKSRHETVEASRLQVPG